MTKFFNITTVLLLVLGLSFQSANAQCDDDDFLDDCAEQLGDYTFLKAYKVSKADLKERAGKQVAEFSYVFSKSTTYKLTICSNENDAKSLLIVKLYDRNRRMVATNYDRGTKKNYPSIGYECKATGVYYLSYSFEGSDSGCGVGILGFNKNPG